MKLYHQFKGAKHQSRAVTLGVFDGIHLGHAKLIKKLCVKAQELNLTSTVITFDDHPHGTLSPAKRPPRLSPSNQCIDRIKSLGVDEVFLIKFTEQLAQQEAQDFVKNILVETLQTEQLVVGQDFIFGRQGEGNVALLKQLRKIYQFKVAVVSPLKVKGHIVSSSQLRKKIAQGQISQANQGLGWTYTLHGIVERGEGRGSQLGLPTANLRTTHEIVPAPGTYAVLADMGNKLWPALCHIGNRPTFHKWGPETIETYIPGWKGRLYGESLAIHFLMKMRQEQQFENAEKLTEQVIKDWNKAKQYWPKAITLTVDDIGPIIEEARTHLGEL